MLPRPLPYWFALASALLLSAAATHMLRRPTPTPHTLTELVEIIEQSPAPLHIVKTTTMGVESGIYLCASPRSLGQLDGLLRIAEHTDRWHGVVFCEYTGSHSQIPEAILESWGDHTMQIGDLLFFGDPTLLRQIQATVGQGQRR